MGPLGLMRDMATPKVIKRTLEAAIHQGAPLFNAGRADKCVELYRRTAAAVLSSGTAGSAESDALREALAATDGELTDFSAAAWVMRRAFDSILDGTVITQQQRKADAAASTAAAAAGRAATGAAACGGEAGVGGLEFEDGLPSEPLWVGGNDGVMGGVSSSSLTWDAEDQTAVFSGNVSEANNGGFASMRTQPWGGWGLEDAGSLKLLVQGDGRTYKMQAKGDDSYDGVMYQLDFPTKAVGPDAEGSAAWEEVVLPFAAFRPNFRGSPVAGRPPLVGARVRQLSFMVSKFGSDGGKTPGFRAGRFRLAVKWVRGVV